jgi:hypothetical protein
VVHRVAVFDAHGEITHVVSQMDVIQCGPVHEPAFPGACLPACLPAWRAGACLRGGRAPACTAARRRTRRVRPGAPGPLSTAAGTTAAATLHSPLHALCAGTWQSSRRRPSTAWRT